jgi:toxin HigB-1
MFAPRLLFFELPWIRRWAACLLKLERLSNPGPIGLMLDKRTIICYALGMIRSFNDSRTEKLSRGVVEKSIPSDVARRAVNKLFLMATVTRLEDLRVPPGNQLEALKGNRLGQHSIRVNQQWRICFVWRDGHAYDVEFVDCH